MHVGVHTNTLRCALAYSTSRLIVRSLLIRSERRLRVCVVRIIAGPSPTLPLSFCLLVHLTSLLQPIKIREQNPGNLFCSVTVQIELCTHRPCFSIYFIQIFVPEHCLSSCIWVKWSVGTLLGQVNFWQLFTFLTQKKPKQKPYLYTINYVHQWYSRM